MRQETETITSVPHITFLKHSENFQIYMPECFLNVTRLFWIWDTCKHTFYTVHYYYLIVLCIIQLLKCENFMVLFVTCDHNFGFLDFYDLFVSIIT